MLRLVLTLLLCSACGSVTQGIEARLRHRLGAARDTVGKLADLDAYPDAPAIRQGTDNEIRRLGDVRVGALSDEPKRLENLAPGQLVSNSGDLAHLPPTFSRLFQEGHRLEKTWTQTLEFWVRQQHF